MGNTQSFGTLFFSAGIVGTIISGISVIGGFFAAYFFGFTAEQNEGVFDALSDRDLRSTITDWATFSSVFKNKRRNAHTALVLSAIIALTIKYLVLVTTSQYTFNPRVDTSYNALILNGCSESMVDDGVCTVTNEALLQIVVMGLLAISRGMFFKYKSVPAAAHAVSTIFVFTALALFGLWSPPYAKWTFYGVACFFMILVGLLTFLSFWDAIKHGKKVDKENELGPRDLPQIRALPDNEYPDVFTSGTLVNAVNYRPGTAEGATQIYTIIGLLAYLLIAGTGTDGGNVLKQNRGLQLILTVVLDILFVILQGIYMIYAESRKSRVEEKPRTNESQFGKFANNIKQTSILKNISSSQFNQFASNFPQNNSYKPITNSGNFGNNFSNQFEPPTGFGTTFRSPRQQSFDPRNFPMIRNQ